MVCCAALQCPKVAAEFVHRTASVRFSARKWRRHLAPNTTSCTAGSQMHGWRLVTNTINVLRFLPFRHTAEDGVKFAKIPVSLL